MRCPCRAKADAARKAEHDAKRPSAAERGYGSKWQAARIEYLARHQWCERCLAAGRRAKATVVNHRIAHKGDLRLFWSRSNWEPVCTHHHNSTIQSEERRGMRAEPC
jgi:5-methylcytosine-specific restriction protein A